MEPLKMVEETGTPETTTNPRARVIRTGFQRVDERTGKTTEMFLCSKEPKCQSYVFFVDPRRASGKHVLCPFCNEKHLAIGPIDAVLDARLSADTDTEASSTNLDVADLLPVILERVRRSGKASVQNP